ncbi:DUF4113 domain-containing protein [Photorhabdus heterorhabditis subsp. aluminescens]|nr:DUF4113 domain-containing protein [Photorhabdus heterorhabditis subsp. aluminescens]
MKTLDQLNNSGIGKVWFAGKGIDTSWCMKREILSPAYRGSVVISAITPAKEK